MSYDVVQAQSFWDCVTSMRQDGEYHKALVEAVIELRQKPFRNPKLNTHYIGEASNGKKLFSSDVGGRRSDRRIIWQLFNKTIVLLLYGTHAVHERAKRMRIASDPAEQVVTVYERAPDSPTDSPAEHRYNDQRVRIGCLFMAWTDEELISFGFPSPMAAVLRRINSDDELLEIAEELGPDHFERAFNLVAFGHPDGEPADLATGTSTGLAGGRGSGAATEADEPETTDDDREIERQLDDERAGAWFTRTEPEVLAEILTQPIEDWMIFLHPDQRAAVSRRYAGPARVRGAAGTGKTVVGLHRAAWLASRNRGTSATPPVLFTTFIKSLPPVFESLYLRLPGTRASEVEFTHIDRLARQICNEDGERLTTNPGHNKAAFTAAYDKVVTHGSPLDVAGFSQQYLQDEITAVVKGRGITSLDVYMDVARTGRRAPMNRSQRAQVWELMLEWNAGMAAGGSVDFVDVVVKARDHARQLLVPRYSAVIIDEAQDLTLVGLQLVRALVNGQAGSDVPDGLLLLGDGAQRIYAGGFKLRQAGIEVRGRTTVLRTNYRNTSEIIDTALTVTGDGMVDDLGEEFLRRDGSAKALRDGPKPLLIEAADIDGQIDEIAWLIDEFAASGRGGLGDVGVLVPTNRLVTTVVRGLSGRRLATQDLAKYDGRPNQCVKVGTFHRGKGLEFKVVFLPDLSAGSFPRRPRQSAGTDPTSAEEVQEAEDLAISQLFVAMTRARDQLVVLYSGEPAPIIARNLDRFDHVP